MVDKVPASHLLLISISALSALEAEIPWELICKRLPDVVRYIQSPNGWAELDDACMSLNYIIKRFLRQQLPIPQSVMDKVPYLVQYLTHSSRYVQKSSNAVLETIASDSDEQCQVLLDSTILDVLSQFLDDSRKCAQACTTISKFTAGNAQQIGRIIEKGIMKKLIDIAEYFYCGLRKRKGASWAIANALDGRRTLEQFRSLVLDGAIESLCKMLEVHSHCYEKRGDKGHLKIKTTERLLWCLDQATIHLPSLQGPDSVIVSKLVARIEKIFMRQGYQNYQRESKNGVT